MLEVTEIPYTDIQPILLDDWGEEEFNQPLAAYHGGRPIGVNQVMLTSSSSFAGGIFPAVFVLGSSGISARQVYNEDWSDHYPLHSMTATRLVKFGNTSEEIWGRAYANDGGMRTHTTVADDGFSLDGLPAFILRSNHPTTPHLNDRWHDHRPWMTSATQAWVCSWLSAGAFGTDANSYFVYLIPWELNGVEKGAVGAPIQLGPAGSWLQGNCFDLGGGVWFAHDRMHPSETAPDGYRDDRARLRAYDYSGTLLAMSDPISQQEVVNDEDAYSYTECVKAVDGSIVSFIDTDWYTSDLQYSRHESWLKRHRYAGGAFVEENAVLLWEGEVGDASWVNNIEPIDEERTFVDYIRNLGRDGNGNHLAERVLALVDYDFNILEEYVFPGNAYHVDLQWSVVAPGQYGLAGDVFWNEEINRERGHVYLVQHSSLIDGVPLDNRRRFVRGRRH
jgi:hypothetical protein